MSPITRSLVAAVIAGTAAMAVPHIAEGAPIIVDQGFWGTPNDVGTMAWAIDQANTMPGTDTISITAGLEINVDAASALPGTNTWLARFTESADVQGNGARLVGNPAYITTGGEVATKTTIVANSYSPAIIPGEAIVTPGFNFAQIGTSGADNSGTSVSFTDLGADGLASFAQLHENAQVSVTGGAFDNMVNYTDSNAAGRPVFQAFTGSTLDLSDISITRSYPFANAVEASSDYALFFGTIQGEDSQLNLENSLIDSSYGAGAVFWNGGTANIVSSVISDSGGLSIADGATTDGVLNFVNSILYMTGGDNLSQTRRIQAADGGEANVLASSILYDTSNTLSTGCNSGITYGCNGMPLTATLDGLLRFDSSVVLPLSADFFFPGKESYSEFSSGDLVAGDYSYIAATQAQGANAVKSLFDNPNVLTEGYTYDLILDALVPEIAFFNPLPDGAIPALDGVLVGVIPDAGPDGANELINPITWQPITTDVYGNPRTNVFGFRDIGAVQAVPVPEPPLLLTALAGFALYRIASYRKHKCRSAGV